MIGGLIVVVLVFGVVVGAVLGVLKWLGLFEDPEDMKFHYTRPESLPRQLPRRAPMSERVKYQGNGHGPRPAA